MDRWLWRKDFEKRGVLTFKTMVENATRNVNNRRGSEHDDGDGIDSVRQTLRRMYTVSQKTCHSTFVRNCNKCMQTDFQNSFAVSISQKFATKLRYYFPQHLSFSTTADSGYKHLVP